MNSDLNMRIRQTIEASLEALSTRLTHEPFESVFPVCLVASCLSRIPGTESIRERLIDLIRKERLDDWSWRYALDYPPDLDDTACALIALEESSPDALAAFSKHLIRTETGPGGPYRTWITGAPGWDDIDVGVNANIAYCLGLRGIFLDKLDGFLRDRASRLSFESLYYHRPIVVAYYLARYLSLRPGRNRALASFCRETAARRANPLEVSFAIAALKRLGERPDGETLEYILETRQENGSWSAFPLYIERIRDGETTYFESEAVTTAFCLEALSLCVGESEPVKDDDEDIFQETVSSIKSAFPGALDCFSPGIERLLERFKESGNDRAIALLPYHFDPCSEKNRLVALGAANLLGWIGYTVEDDIVDEGAYTEFLSLSNACLRRSFELFLTAAPDESMRAYVRKTFNLIDRANDLELKGKADETTLYQKSFGHALGPLILFAQKGHGPESLDFKILEDFFRHYLSARQMNDDAHDWREDVRSDQRTSVTEIFRKHRKGSPERFFWNFVIDEIVEKINIHCSLARKAAKELQKNGALESSAFLESLVSPLERSAGRALTERDKTRRFFDVFSLPRTRMPMGSGRRTS